MTEHTECISMEILRREAKDTLDPEDPMVGMYSKKTAQENKENKHNKEEVKAEELESRWTKRRILVNPDFVQVLRAPSRGEDLSYLGEIGCVEKSPTG